MRVLLTGGSGQVGTEFRRRATGLDLLAPTRAELDLADPHAIAPWLQRAAPDLILNVGAYTAVDRAEDEPEQAFTVNGDAVAVLADYAEQHHKPLIHLSTDYVFDGAGEFAYRESDPVAPVGVYGASKLAGEQAARAASEHLILRVSWVFASHGQNFVRTMLRLAGERSLLRVVDDQIGGPTWAGHIAQTLRVLVDRHAAGQSWPRGTWHYAGSPALSWCAFAREIIGAAHARGLIAQVPEIQGIPTHEYPTKARRPANSRLDMTASCRALGLVAPQWRDGLQQVLTELSGG